jgi:hypothetical protein
MMKGVLFDTLVGWKGEKGREGREGEKEVERSVTSTMGLQMNREGTAQRGRCELG